MLNTDAGIRYLYHSMNASYSDTLANKSEANVSYYSHDRRRRLTWKWLSIFPMTYQRKTPLIITNQLDVHTFSLSFTSTTDLCMKILHHTATVRFKCATVSSSFNIVKLIHTVVMSKKHFTIITMACHQTVIYQVIQKNDQPNFSQNWQFSKSFHWHTWQ